MQFRLQRILSETGLPVFIVYPSGYDYGRGFSTLAGVFGFINALYNNQ